MAKRIITTEVEIYTATKPFDFDGRHYEPGDEFEVPSDWKRDAAHEEITGRLTFLVPAIEKTKENPGRDERRLLLPVTGGEPVAE